MKRLILVSVLAILSICMRAQDACELYIAKYSAMAVEEMYRSGVPASITLAQGLLESGMGKSTLATNANNHFGIKCHKWDGNKVYHDDDKPQECFRSYDSAEDSFKDHSDFLRYHDRYKFLFDLEPTDYKGWANGLKAAGYATSPTYPEKLISLIERYELYKFDTVGEEDVKSEEAAVEEAATEVKQEEKAEIKTEQSETGKSRTATTRRERKSRSTSKAQKPSTDVSEPVSTTRPAKPERPEKPERPQRASRNSSRQRPESPAQMERMRPADGEMFSLSRPVYKKNGVECVMAIAGETYYSIAKDYDLFNKEILKFNDVAADAELLPGQIVYIRAKKTQTEKGLDKHICESSDETLWQISQRYGIKLSSLMKMNGLKGDVQLREDFVLKLRKK